eukprot:m.127943 g.127943  ORF g.127943 m.127943 type:complete len:323 (+) comp13615_c0_seq3:235-1203(+)
MGRRGGKKGGRRVAGDSDSEEIADDASDLERKRHGGDASASAETGPKCFKCGSYGHAQAKCPTKGAKAAARRKCYICGETGHTRRECPGIEDGGRGQSKYRSPKSTSRPSRKGRLRKGDDSDDEELAPEVLEVLASCIPLVDLAVFPRMLMKLPSMSSLLTGDTKMPLSMALQSVGGTAAPMVEAYLAIISDPEMLLPESGDPDFRLWESLVPDPRARFAFGLGFTAAGLWTDDLLPRVDDCLTLPGAVAVGLVGLSYSEEPNPEQREGELRLFVAMAKLAVSRKLPFIFELSEGASADGTIYHIRGKSTVVPPFDASHCQP